MQRGEWGVRGQRPAVGQWAAVGWGRWGVSGWINLFRRGFIKENMWAKSSFLQSVQPHFLLVQFVGLLPIFQPVRLKFCEHGRLMFGHTVRKKCK